MEIISEKNTWNEKVISLNGSFLSSWEWGVLQEKLGRKILRVSGSDFIALLIRHDLPFCQHYFYSPRGPVFSKNTKENIISCLGNIERITREEGSIFLRIEPETKIEGVGSMGFKKAMSIQPSASLVLDLNKNEESLLREMEHDTRYSIKTAVRRGVSIKILKTVSQKMKYFEDFWLIFRETNTRHDIKAYSQQYYESIFGLGGECHSVIIVGEGDGMVLSMAVLVFFDKKVTYLYAASRMGYSRFNTPTLVLWEAILEAKRTGATIFDFWGISHEKKEWKGITAFKKSFGGKEINYSGAWDLPLKKGWYGLYNLAKKI